MILRIRLRGVASSLALCAVQFSLGILTRYDKRRWPSSVCVSLLDPWSACRLNCIGKCARLILSSAAANRADPNESPFNKASTPPPTCFAVQPVGCPCPVTADTDTRNNLHLDTTVRSLLCERRSLPLCSPSLPLQGLGVPSPRLSPFRLECRTHCHCHLETMEQARISSILSVSHPSDSGILLMFAERVLIAIPCSLTTTASDDEFSILTNTPGWNRGSHFFPLAGLASMYRIFFPNSSMGVLSLRPCSLCSGVFASLPVSHLFIEVRSKFYQPA